MTTPILDVRDVVTTYQRRGATMHAVDGVSLSIDKEETIGLVGESGCGKSSLGKSIVRLLRPTGGRIEIDGTDIAKLGSRDLMPFRRIVQMVFQDPAGSLNPRSTIATVLERPLFAHGLWNARERRRRSLAMLDRIGLPASALDKFPHQFSGGQKQRIGIARALILRPEFLVADEPVSALDVSIQAQIVNLLDALKAQLGLTILFIAHDLAVVAHICDRIAVMYLGRLMELAPTDALFAAPAHPYTEALFSAAPDPDPTVRRQRIILTGDIPSPIAPPSGCVFRTRCRYAIAACAQAEPAFREVGPGHFKACIRDDLALQTSG